MITNFLVGPAKLYYGVEDFLCLCLQKGYGELGHRSNEFSKFSQETIQNFKDFFNVPSNYRIFYTYSATEGLELSIRNCVEKNVAHISNGNFGNMWAKISKEIGKDIQKFSLETECLHHGERVDLKKVFPNLIKENEMICITANETASGVAYSPTEIYEFSQKISKDSPNTILAVDITSGIGGYAYNFSSADIWVFSIQKALGLPAGLGVMIISEKAYEKSILLEKKKCDIGAHHKFSLLENKMKGKFQTPTTPNFLGILGLGYISKKLKEDFKNMENLADITQKKAEYFYSALEENKYLSPLVKNKKNRSNTTIVVKSRKENVLEDKFLQLQKENIQVSKGYGQFKSENFRIGNFPVHSKKDLENLIQNF